MTTLASRQLFDVDLQPVNGSRFQPTGFPDIGAATFKRFDTEMSDWVDALVVESPQSMANHLEGMAWDAAANEPTALFAGLPYVRVVHADDEGYLTSSRTEAHRLASAFIKESTLDSLDMKSIIRERLGLRDDRPVAPRSIAEAVMRLDPLCLVHGVFFAEKAVIWPGQPRIVRALSAQIEAIDVKPAHLGGVKRDHVRHEISDTGGSAEGYGTIPYHRTEYSARTIRASFNLDLAQIRSYGLGEDATALLVAIARWEIAALLDQPLRLRTACDLERPPGAIVDRSGQSLPSIESLAGEVREGIAACVGLFVGVTPMVVKWRATKRPKKGDAAAPETTS
ncbi:MAG: type I-G CRISPR-associated RAMP protein Csb1/Cas7g [Acidimicrobiales bacterium]